MKLNTVAQIHNRFDIEVRNKLTGKIVQRAFAENIILNQAWAQILSDIDWFTRIYYGTGTGTVLPTRTALFTLLSSKTVASTPLFTENTATNTFSLRQSIVLLETEHVGAVLREVGVGTDTVLCTHAVLKDMNGNAVAITKTDVDIITIYATVYVRISNTPGEMAAVDVVHAGVEENPFLRTLLGKRLTVYLESSDRSMNGWNMIFTAGMGDTCNGAHDYTSPVVTAAFDIPNKKASLYHRIPAASCNVGGIRRILLVGYRAALYVSATRKAFLIRMTNEILTQATVVEQIGVGDGTTTAFKTTFPFVSSGAVVKVDGVVASPTITYNAPNRKDLTGFIRVRTNTALPDRAIFESPLGADPEILENPFHSVYGLTHVTGGRFMLDSSDDSVTWTNCITYTASTLAAQAVPVAHQTKRYFRVTRTSNDSYAKVTLLESSVLDNIKNISFAVAPMAGAVITAEYVPQCAAKDADHVLDVAVTIQLGEYTP